MTTNVNAVNTAEQLAAHLTAVCDAAVAYVAVVDGVAEAVTPTVATRAALRTAVNAAVSTDPIAAP